MFKAIKFGSKNYSEIIICLLFFGCSLLVWPSLLEIGFLPRMLFLLFELLVICIYLFQTNSFLPKPNLTLIAYTLLVIWSFTGFTQSINISELVFGLTKIICGFLTFYLLLTLFGNSPNLKDRLAAYMPAVFLVIIIVNTPVVIWQAYSAEVLSFKESDLKALTGLMSNKNLGAEYFSLLIPFFLFYKTESRFEFLIRWGIPVFIIVFSILLQCRAAFFSAIIALLISVVILISVENRNKRVLFYLVTGFGLIAISFIAINFFSENKVYSLFAEIVNPHKGTGGVRITNWTIALKQMQEHPISGLGLENWKIDFPKYGYRQNGYIFNHRLLNDFFTIGTETGIPGLLLFIILILSPIISFLTIKTLSSSYLHKVAFVVIITYAIIAFFNFPKDRVEHFLLLNFSIALLCPFNASKIKFGNGVLAFFVVIILLGSYITLNRLNSEYNLNKALAFRQQGKWSQVIRFINKAENPFYSLDYSTTPIVWYRGLAYFMQGNQKQARLDFESAYKQHPNHVQVLSNYATMLELDGLHREAEALYKQLIHIAPRFWEAHENYGILLFNQKRYEEGFALFDTRRKKSKQPRYWMVGFNLSKEYWKSLNQEYDMLINAGKTNEADLVAAKLQSVFSKVVSLNFFYAQSLYNRGQEDEAYLVASQSPDKGQKFFKFLKEN